MIAEHCIIRARIESQDSAFRSQNISFYADSLECSFPEFQPPQLAELLISLFQNW